MALPRLCSEGVKALARLAQQGGKHAPNRLYPACTNFSRAYAAEPVPAEGELPFHTKSSALHKGCHKLQVSTASFDTIFCTLLTQH